ncbi:MAG: MoaD family protein [Archaeoglobales archaeon]|jgi:MoaD family protein|nr:MoaD family protein [Archaeoglobus sp.]NHW88057.1 MoaD family protein [Archaeoglobales archaeon]
MPKVKLFAMFREIAGIAEIEVEGKKLGEVILNLVSRYPKLKDIFFSEGKLKEFVQIMVNGRHFRGNLDLEVSERDVVAIFPPVSGG